MSGNRYPIRLGLFRFFLRIIKVKRDTAYVDLDDECVSIRFGYIDAQIPYTNVATVEVRDWPAIYGAGLRIARHRTMGYIGAFGDAVWIQLAEAQRLKAGPGKMGMNRDWVAISVENPEEFAAELQRRCEQTT